MSETARDQMNESTKRIPEEGKAGKIGSGQVRSMQGHLAHRKLTSLVVRVIVEHHIVNRGLFPH